MADYGLLGRVARRLTHSARNQQIGGDVRLRTTDYGDLYVHDIMTGRQSAALSGNYFTFTEGTIGTAVATTTSITGYDATKPVLLIHNNGQRDIVMDMLKFMIVQVPTSATSWQFWVKTYNGNAYASAGTQVTPTNANGNSENTTGAVVYIGAPVASETGLTGRSHSGGAFRGIIPTTFDSFSLEFGGDAPGSGALLTSGSAKYNENVPPLVLAPGHSMTVGMFGASNAAAPSFRYTGGYFEV
jgi:hypothetical protein